MTEIVSIVSARTEKNGLLVTVRDSIGRDEALILSPLAQEQLIQVLLVAPPLATNRRSPYGLFAARSVRLAEDAHGQAILELTIGPQLTLHIQLPHPVLEGLKNLLNEWVTPLH